MDWTELLRADPALLVPERHGEALTRAATRFLREGRAGEAAALLHRRMRLAEPLAAAERALLALACSLNGEEGSAATLAGALAADPLDPTVALVALRLVETPEEARAAARRLLRSPIAGDDAVRRALAVLFAHGETAAARLDLVDGRLTGWIAWRGQPAPILVLGGPIGETRHGLAPEPDLAFLPPDASGTPIDLPAADAARYALERGGTRLAAEPLAPRSRQRAGTDDPVRHVAPNATPTRRPSRIVVPVFGDPDATREALRAAVLEAARMPGTRVVAVDDCSPFPAVTTLLEALAGRGLVELRRTPRNLGFPGAVALGLEGAEAEDALILNADAVLPPGALARLADAAYAAPDIGTATPLSNNGEWTSWPRLGDAAPSPDEREAARIDAAVRRLALPPVDLPNGIGFALFVRHDCLRAIGTPSRIYERGYFEDLEWTLQARRAGFRNVAAPSVFVVHHGSRSFGTDKPRLVARNLRRLRRRFPEIQAESAAFRRADPLLGARAALEEACPPADRPPLLVAPAGSPLLAERLHRAASGAQTPVVLRWRRVGTALRAELRRVGGAPPQSLNFDLPSQEAALIRWLTALRPCRVELAGPPPTPSLTEAILALDVPSTILAGEIMRSPSSPAPLLDAFEAWRDRLGDRWERVLAFDRWTLAALREKLDGERQGDRIEAALAPPREGIAMQASEPTLGIVMGIGSPGSTRFAFLLAASMRDRMGNGRLTVLGATADDLALLGRGIGVSGRLLPSEYAGAALRAETGALVLPPADPSLALFDRLLAETGLPGACLDWSGGSAEPMSPSLVLDRSRDERDHVHAIVDWFAGRFAA